MAKRFTETTIWDEDWFLNLSNKEMLLWFYIKDNCDHAGIWKPNFKKFTLFAKSKINEMEFLNKINKDKTENR